jgi:hypothetical protein
MTSWLVYDVATGLIVKQAMGPRVRFGAGQTAIEAPWPGPGHFVRDGAVHPLPPCPGDWAVFDPVAEAWSDTRPPEVRAAALVAEVTAAIEAHVDATARQRLYSGAVSAASYLGSTEPMWAAEAAAFVAWRDAVWAWALAQLALFQGGAPMPGTIAQFLAEAPPMNWPEEPPNACSGWPTDRSRATRSCACAAAASMSRAMRSC